MEYEILGLKEGASTEEAKKALNKIRLEYHPDKLTNLSRENSDKHARFLMLAENAYKRVKNKNKVNESIFNFFDTQFTPNVSKSTSKNTVFASSYSYQNVNGKVHEHGIVNGKPMTAEELSKKRSSSHFSIL